MARWAVSLRPYRSKMTLYTTQALEQSSDMTPVAGSVEVNIPADVLWECFTHADSWPRWNPCMFWVRNRDLTLGQPLVWAFEPIRWWYLYKLPGLATIVEVEQNRKVTWEVTALPGFFARHTYFVEDLGGGRSRFGSWEQAMGPTFRLLKWFWVVHFVFVKDRSLTGAQVLETIYQRTGRIDLPDLPPKNYWPSLLLLLAVLVAIFVILRGLFNR